MNGPKNMFWDSCVFIRWLTQSPPELASDIDSFIKDAQRGHRTIYFSTLAFAEVRQRYLRQGGFATIQAFVDDFSGVFMPVDPSPNVMMNAGLIRDAMSTNPSDPNNHSRIVSTPDAIQLASCLYVKQTFEVSDIVFHSFDRGRSKGWEGKCVTMIGFQDWFPAAGRSRVIQDVCDLTRTEPLYPQISMFAPDRPGAGRDLTI